MEKLPSDIWYCDDVIPKSTQDRFLGYVASTSFNWNDFNHMKTAGTYGEMSHTVSSDEVTVYPSDALIKLAYANDGRNKVTLEETATHLAMSVLDEYAKRNGVYIVDILRIKINCQTRSQFANYDINSCNDIHIDNEVPNNKTLVYYINDSDGDTFLFDKLFDGKTDHYDVKTLMQVHPKKGRAIVFDSWRFHAPSNPLFSQRRYVLNINFIEDGL